jgi:hypothetical protein
MRPPPPRPDTTRRDDLAQAIFLAWVSQATSPDVVLARPEVVRQQAEAAFKLADQFMVVQRTKA